MGCSLQRRCISCSCNGRTMNHCSCDKLSRLKMYGHCRTRQIASTVIQQVSCYWFWEERENLWAYQSMLLLTASARGEGKKSPRLGLRDCQERGSVKLAWPESKGAKTSHQSSRRTCPGFATLHAASLLSSDQHTGTGRLFYWVDLQAASLRLLSSDQHTGTG